MLQKAAIYISSLDGARKELLNEQALLQQQVDHLRQTISLYQTQLPAAGGPVGCQRTNRAREMLQDYIKRRSMENWKFWVFSTMIEPLFESYYQSVSTNSLEEACKSIFTWLDRCCNLTSLRKDILDSLTFLSTSTNVLNSPETVPSEAMEAVRLRAANHFEGDSNWRPPLHDGHYANQQHHWWFPSHPSPSPGAT